MRDLSALAAAVHAEPGSGGTTIFVAGPAMAAQAAMVEPYFNDLIFPSAAVPTNRIIAIDPKGIAHTFGDVSINSTIHGTLHVGHGAADRHPAQHHGLADFQSVATGSAEHVAKAPTADIAGSIQP